MKKKEEEEEGKYIHASFIGKVSMRSKEYIKKPYCRCKDSIYNDPKIVLDLYVKGPNNIICRAWV